MLVHGMFFGFGCASEGPRDHAIHAVSGPFVPRRAELCQTLTSHPCFLFFRFGERRVDPWDGQAGHDL